MYLGPYGFTGDSPALRIIGCELRKVINRRIELGDIPTKLS